MSRVSAEYRIDYQSFREAEWKALHQALYAGCGENVENFNRLLDQAAKHGAIRLIEERLWKDIRYVKKSATRPIDMGN